MKTQNSHRQGETGGACDALIREANQDDFGFVSELMHNALEPFYDGDHRAHAKRIFCAHMKGGADQVGHFSFEQRMFVLKVEGSPAGMIHVVGKHQGTYKISPLIVAPEYRGKKGLGSMLLEHAEQYAKQQEARQMYCTVAEQNFSALQFFLRKGYVMAGRSDSHYKPEVTEVMLYKLLASQLFDMEHDKMSISVVPFNESHAETVRKLILGTLPKFFMGVSDSWVDSLFSGYTRRHTRDINEKFKLIFVAVDSDNNVLGVIGATPKKGQPIKLMPFIGIHHHAFAALLTDVPNLLKDYGRKLYVHIVPTVEETIHLQRLGWKLSTLMPAAYHNQFVTQQWCYDINQENFMRTMRVKQQFLDLIREGSKTLEVRVGYDHIKAIQPGEHIRLTSHRDAQRVKVLVVRNYPNFAEMLDAEDPNAIAPGKQKNEVLELLQAFYPPERENLGVVVFEIKTA